MSISHVLIIDDENVIRLTLSLMLKKFGVSSEVTEDGATAEVYYRDNWQEVDLVVIDQNMPDTTGVDLFNKLKKINPSIHAILCSGFIDESEKYLIDEVGFSRVLSKPLSLSDLKSLL